MISAEIIIDKRYSSKNGYAVKIRVYDSVARKNGLKSRDYIPLNIYQQNENLQLTSNLKRRQLDLEDQVDYCNKNLLNLDESINIIQNGIPTSDLDIEIQTLEKRLQLLKSKKGLENEVGLIEFSNTLISEKKALNKPILIYENTIKAIKRFIEPKDDIAINSITREWIQMFDIFHIGKGLKDNTVYTYISIARAIYKEAQLRESLNIKKDNPFLKLRVFTKDKVATELTTEDLKKMVDLKESDIKTKSYLGAYGIKRLADIVLFQFCIGGQDLADIANLKWENIIDGRVKFRRYKNRFKKSSGEELDNYLNKYALGVIERYGDKNSDRVFSFLGTPDSKEYRANVLQFNKYIFKIISQHINSESSFTTKSTRYVFRTAGGNLLIDSFVMMRLMGHKPVGVTFGYQGAINYEVQDREHQKILDLVFK